MGRRQATDWDEIDRTEVKFVSVHEHEIKAATLVIYLFREGSMKEPGDKLAPIHINDITRIGKHLLLGVWW